MARVLVVYETFNGQSARIAERIRLCVSGAGHEVSMRRASAAAGEIEAHDAVIVGGPVRFGRHAPALEAFVRRNARSLARMPAAFFTVCLSAAGPNPKHAEAASYGDKLFASAGWKPQARAIFAGALLYRQYGLAIRLMMRFVVGVAGGDTDTSRDHEYTDWAEVERFAREFAASLGGARAAA